MQAEEPHLFIYYRVTDADAACLAATQAQATLRASRPTLQAACYVRADAQGSTLMETYAHPGGVDGDLQRWIAAQMEPTMAAWLAGPRRLEAFKRVS
jgi:Domain of unknown function (DUF4936)